MSPLGAPKAMIGVMQGRLLPPIDGKLQAFPPDWRKEFALAKRIGFKFLEWVHESVDPLNAPSKIAEIRELGSNGVPVLCLDAHYFVSHPLISKSGTFHEPTVDHLWWLLQRAEELRLHHVTIPFLDTSRLKLDAQKALLPELCRRISIRLAKLNVRVHLETDLPADFLVPLYTKYPAVRDTYDTGNRARMEDSDLAKLIPFVGAVHIKDTLGGVSVKLGSGEVRWGEIFRILHGRLLPITIQANRRLRPGMEYEHTYDQLQFVKDGLANAF